MCNRPGRRYSPLILLCGAAVLAGCASSEVRFLAGESETGSPLDADAPGLAVGAGAPDAYLLDAESREVSLSGLYRDGPTVVVFYRGGWCTYCNQTLAAWAERAREVEAAGARVIALSPETPEHVDETATSHGSALTIYSDARHEAARGFGVLDDLGTLDRVGYSIGGIDLDEWNESGEWSLPAAATFVVDREGIVRYRFADWDHTKRADPDDVLRAVRALD